MLRVLLMLLLVPGLAHGQNTAYEATVERWKDYHDVAKWLDSNFSFDRTRLRTILERVRQDGPAGLLAHKASLTYETKVGYCTDSAKFAIDSLNKINPSYQARYVFVNNKAGPAQHWVTGFMVDGKIMVMDFGASPEWSSMKGVHGPYDSLKGYADFLSGLRVRGFSVGFVEWREMPGQED